MEYWNIIVQALGTIATVISVFWAIHVYRKANENKSYLEIKDNIIKIPEICHEINSLLTEPFFAAIGNSISKELKELYSSEQTLEDFSEFLLDDESSHNYKALAIYSGLKQCTEVSEINDLIKDIQDAERIVTVRCPYLGKSFSKLSFYITRAAQRTISSRILNRSMTAKFEDESTNEAFKSAIKSASESGSVELYFKEIAIFITAVAKTSLKNEHLGQRTIDLSYTMLKIAGNVFGLLSEFELKKISKKDFKLRKKNYSTGNKHAVEDAMDILKKYKKYYSEDQWDKLIECKGRIIELMESDDDTDN
ncbi:MAG: hypothetical protein IKF99_05400 [Oscillospiraceae bacterium]|nr:hypothetical protein [Oscillospiraceae bacterium]